MRRLGKFLLELLRAEDGPSAIEYAVLMALVVVVCLSAISIVGNKAKTTFTRVANSIAGS
jgi:pilus assembly protein Flp/PilA